MRPAGASEDAGVPAPDAPRAAAPPPAPPPSTSPGSPPRWRRCPRSPGCYLWKDASGTIIYVGKAKNLRARMRQYVTLADERAKIPLMMQLVESFDYIVVDSEHEALVLERELIGQYRPYFNVDFKDDKSYPFIAITRGDVFPAIKYTREKHKPGTRYFGPYTDSRAARDVIDTIRKVIPICSASCAEWKRTRRLIEAHAGDEDIIGLICAQKGRPVLRLPRGARPRGVRGRGDARGVRRLRAPRGAVPLRPARRGRG